MSLNNPEVGDVFRWMNIYSRITQDYFITKVDGYCDEYSFSTIADFSYIGKSKTNINNLFEKIK